MKKVEAMARRPSKWSISRMGVGLATLICVVLFAATAVNTQPPREERIVIEYVPPINSAHRPIYDMIKEMRGLERVKVLLEPVRWPRPLRVELKGCAGDSDAWYEDAIITVCYEYVEDMWKRANSSLPPAITREDAFIGPLLDTFLHEAGHALFDLLKIPLLGREEDAADYVAAYIVLRAAPKDRVRQLIIGSAYAYADELKVRSASDLTRLKLGVGRHATFADEHGTPAQRLYNLLCVSYGSDKVLFADVVEKGFLPKGRAEMCEDEYKQIDYAYRTLIAPHIDSGK